MLRRYIVLEDRIDIELAGREARDGVDGLLLELLLTLALRDIAETRRTGRFVGVSLPLYMVVINYRGNLYRLDRQSLAMYLQRTCNNHKNAWKVLQKLREIIYP